MKEEITRKCPYTGALFTPKRNNQIYKDSAAQIEHNNVQARKIREKFNPYFKIFIKNYLILDLIFKSKKGVASLDFLEGKGFDRRYIMSLYIGHYAPKSIPVYQILEYTFYYHNNQIHIQRKP